MEFGMFHEFQRRPGQTEAEAFAESFAQVDEAEAAGLDVMCSPNCTTPPSVRSSPHRSPSPAPSPCAPAA